jgi:hypothetical protein
MRSRNREDTNRTRSRICILGNSHAACLKLAWDHLTTAYPNFELVFFAARGLDLRFLRVSGNALVAKKRRVTESISFTSGGAGKVKVDRFDAFLTYALALRVPDLDSRLSSAVKTQTCEDALSRSLNLRICRMIRQVSDAPIYIGHNPQPASGDELPSEQMKYAEVFDLLAKELDIAGTNLVAQPPETLVNGWNTRPELAKGSTRLDIGDNRSNEPHPESDVTHLNIDFGRVYLEHLFHKVAQS